jgi:2-oxoglutarate ferredoxin oxidoreductase subunit gamma
MREKIIIAGAGGQGVMLLGKIMAGAAMREGRFVTYLPSYGPEVRGGTSHCMLVISDSEIGSPYIAKADALIIMNAPSLERFRNRLVRSGLLIINSSLVEESDTGNARALRFPFTDLAIKLGNIRVANTIALGCFVARKRILSLKTIVKVMEDMAPQDKKGLVGINKKALQEGARL